MRVRDAGARCGCEMRVRDAGARCGCEMRVRDAGVFHFDWLRRSCRACQNNKSQMNCIVGHLTPPATFGVFVIFCDTVQSAYTDNGGISCQKMQIGFDGLSHIL